MEKLMFDKFLTWFVIVSPTLLAIGIELASKDVRQSRFWRWGVVAFGIVLSATTYWQIGRQEAHARDAQTKMQQTFQTSMDGLNAQLDAERLAHASDSQYLRGQLDKLNDFMPAVFKLAEASEENTRKTYQDKEMGNKALREFTLATARKMREWDARYDLAREQNFTKFWQMKEHLQTAQHPTAEQLQQFWDKDREMELEQSAEESVLDSNFEAEFRQSILADAIFAREQLLARLGASEEPTLGSPNTTRAIVRQVFQGHFYGPDPAVDAATYLELFARKVKP
jgi:hypothetical protein